MTAADRTDGKRVLSSNVLLDGVHSEAMAVGITLFPNILTQQPHILAIMTT
jgi:hypothetical protein